MSGKRGKPLVTPADGPSNKLTGALDVALKEDSKKKVATDESKFTVVTPSMTILTVDDAKVSRRVMGTLARASSTASVSKGKAQPGRGKMETVPLWIAYVSKVTGSSNTFLNVSLPFQPDACNEFTDFAAIFDEVKVMEGKACYVVETSGTATMQGSYMAAVYDPIDPSGFTTISQMITFDKHQLTYFSLANNTGGVTAQPMPIAKHGFWTIQAKVPKGTAQTKAASGVFGDQWFDMHTSTTVACGYLKWGIPALGTGVTAALNAVVYLKVMFRCRV